MLIWSWYFYFCVSHSSRSFDWHIFYNSKTVYWQLLYRLRSQALPWKQITVSRKRAGYAISHNYHSTSIYLHDSLRWGWVSAAALCLCAGSWSVLRVSAERMTLPVLATLSWKCIRTSGTVSSRGSTVFSFYFSPFRILYHRTSLIMLCSVTALMYFINVICHFTIQF